MSEGTAPEAGEKKELDPQQLQTFHEKYDLFAELMKFADKKKHTGPEDQKAAARTAEFEKIRGVVNSLKKEAKDICHLLYEVQQGGVLSGLPTHGEDASVINEIPALYAAIKGGLPLSKGHFKLMALALALVRKDISSDKIPDSFTSPVNFQMKSIKGKEDLIKTLSEKYETLFKGISPFIDQEPDFKALGVPEVDVRKMKESIQRKNAESGERGPSSARVKARILYQRARSKAATLMVLGALGGGGALGHEYLEPAGVDRGAERTFNEKSLHGRMKDAVGKLEAAVSKGAELPKSTLSIQPDKYHVKRLYLPSILNLLNNPHDRDPSLTDIELQEVLEVGEGKIQDAEQKVSPNDKTKLPNAEQKANENKGKPEDMDCLILDDNEQIILTGHSQTYLIKTQQKLNVHIGTGKQIRALPIYVMAKIEKGGIRYTPLLIMNEQGINIKENQDAKPKNAPLTVYILDHEEWEPFSHTMDATETKKIADNLSSAYQKYLAMRAPKGKK